MDINEDELFSQLYADNLLLKAQTKLLMHLIMVVASECGYENAVEKLNAVYASRIDKYLEDQILASPLKDEHLQLMAEEFLKKVKDGL